MSNLDVNSKLYWERRFDSNWIEYNGCEQTKYFANLALNMLPEFLYKDLQENEYNICDAGCALGQAVPLLADAFPLAKVVGMDFASSAIDQAKRFYPQHDFIVGDLLDLSDTYDVFFVSNTLEHFSDPISVIGKILQKTKKYLIFLVPFQEYGTLTEEHFFVFDHDTFPEKIDDSRRIVFRISDGNKSRKKFWDGKQTLVVYAKNYEGDQIDDVGKNVFFEEV